MTTPTRPIYVPPDAGHSDTTWHATPGPAVVAALVGKPVADIRYLFPGPINDGPRNEPTALADALRALGCTIGEPMDKFPTHGLAFVQLVSRTLYVPLRPVAVVHHDEYRMVYDFYNRERNWLPADVWEHWTLPASMSAYGAKTWKVETAWEVIMPIDI